MKVARTVWSGGKAREISKVYLSLLVSVEHNVLYIEQASKLSNFDDETIGNILTHCNGNEVKRKEQDNPNRTSLVFCGNCLKEYILHSEQGSYTFPKEFDIKFFDILPKEIKEEQGLERMIILPSFLLEKIKTKWIEKIDDEEKNKIRMSIDTNRRAFIEYKLDNNLEIRDYKAQCKIITCLNFFINSDNSLNEEDIIFKGFKAIATSLTDLKKGIYTPFYYKNEDGRKLSLILILDKLPQNSIIEEAHFLKHRALVKVKGEKIWYKIALDSIGKAENTLEYEFFKKNNSEYISKIIEISSNNIVLKQEYIPLYSNYLAIKDLNFLDNDNENPIEVLKKEFREEIIKNNREIKELKETVNTMLWAIKLLYKNIEENFYLPISEIKEELPALEEIKEELVKKLITVIPNIKNTSLKSSYIGIQENEAVLINFADLIKNRYIS